jgi:REP element-mobilizing transposase RayT
VPRNPRDEFAGAIHHVIARGNAGRAIVDDNDDRRDFVSRLASISGRFGWRVHAYCLMDTHLHAVIETPEPPLGRGMQRLLGGYAYEFNRRHGRYGHLFASRYSAALVESDAHLLELCVYVVLNPVRAGIVERPEDWVWSSYRATAGITASLPFLETGLVPEMLSSERERAAELYRQMVRDVLARPRASPSGGLAEARPQQR